MPTNLLTFIEVAEELRLPESSLRHLRANGRGPHMFRVGRRLVCKAEEVARYIEERSEADTQHKATA